MKIELSCRRCGSNRFKLDEAVNDAAVVVCEECGHEIGTLGKIKEEVAERVLANARR